MRFLPSILLVVLLAACGGPLEPTVSESVPGERMDRTPSLYSFQAWAADGILISEGRLTIDFDSVDERWGTFPGEWSFESRDESTPHIFRGTGSIYAELYDEPPYGVIWVGLHRYRDGGVSLFADWAPVPWGEFSGVWRQHGFNGDVAGGSFTATPVPVDRP